MLEKFIKSIHSTENIYDLIACCCDCIYSIVLNEELFMSIYIDRNFALNSDHVKDGEGKGNPNIGSLNKLSESIMVKLFDTMGPLTKGPKDSQGCFKKANIDKQQAPGRLSQALYHTF